MGNWNWLCQELKNAQVMKKLWPFWSPNVGGHQQPFDFGSSEANSWKVANSYGSGSVKFLVFKHLKKPPAMEKQANMTFQDWNPTASSEFHLFLLAENMQSTRNNRLNQPSGLSILWFLPKHLVIFVWSKKLILEISLSIRKWKKHISHLGKSQFFFNPWNLEIKDVLIMRLQRNLCW